MAELAHDTQPEFWRPPTSSQVEQEIGVQETATHMAEVCPRCGTEYLLGSHFCHSCGGKRPAASSATVKPAGNQLVRLWEQSVESLRAATSGISLPDFRMPGWLHYLSVHEIQNWLGLSTAPFVAFLIGLGCILGALLVGLLTAKTLLDWQAIQFYRGEWLLGATASFVAGILLKNRSRKND